jgi:hypothetical protein
VTKQRKRDGRLLAGLWSMAMLRPSSNTSCAAAQVQGLLEFEAAALQTQSGWIAAASDAPPLVAASGADSLSPSRRPRLYSASGTVQRKWHLPLGEDGARKSLRLWGIALALLQHSSAAASHLSQVAVSAACSPACGQLEFATATT